MSHFRFNSSPRKSSLWQVCFLSALICLLMVSSVAIAEEDLKYSQVRIEVNSPEEMWTLQETGAAIDHPYQDGNAIIVVLNSWDLEQLRSADISYEIVVEDLVAAYEEENNVSEAEIAELSAIAKEEHGLVGFDYGSMGGYLTYDEIEDDLDEMFSLYPSLITARTSIGAGHEGNDIWMVKISDNPGVDEAETEVLYSSLHHAREPQSMMTLHYFMWHLLENYGVDEEVTYLVDNRELYFVTCVNPDGYLYNQSTNPNGGGFWRKNRRDNGGSSGVDLNRNYGHQWGYDNSGSSPTPSSDTYRGPSAFSEPETQAMRDFANSREFQMAFNYHTYSDLLIYPWGYIANFYTPDHDMFVTMGEDMTQFNNYTHGTANQTVGYLVNGEANDWFYGEQTSKPKVFAMTPEVGGFSDGFWPSISRIIPLAEENVYPNMQLAWGIDTQIDCSVTLNQSSGSGSFTYQMSFSNVTSTTVNNDIWAIVTGPGGYEQQAFVKNKNFAASAGANKNKNFTIPGGEPTGDYTFTLHTGIYPGLIKDSDSQVYTKTSSPLVQVVTGTAASTVPTAMSLEQNYPNPFNPTTSIQYGLTAQSQVTVVVYDMLGKTIKTLVNDVQGAGLHTVVWDGRNDHGETVSTGIYFYTMKTDGFTQSRKMLLTQ